MSLSKKINAPTLTRFTALLVLFPNWAYAEAFKGGFLSPSQEKTLFFGTLAIIFGLILIVVRLWVRINKKIDADAPSFGSYMPRIILLLLIILGIYFILSIAP